MSSRSPFDDPVVAAALWTRFRRLMLWMFLATVLTVGIAIRVLYKQEGMVSVHFYIAVAIGMSAAMMLMSALMGLVFLSNASGHDASVDERVDDRED